MLTNIIPTFFLVITWQQAHMVEKIPQYGTKKECVIAGEHVLQNNVFTDFDCIPTNYKQEKNTMRG